MIGWQWHQLDHMKIICISLQTDDHASTSPLSFYGLNALTATQQQHQSTESLKGMLCYLSYYQHTGLYLYSAYSKLSHKNKLILFFTHDFFQPQQRFALHDSFLVISSM